MRVLVCNSFIFKDLGMFFRAGIAAWNLREQSRKQAKDFPAMFLATGMLRILDLAR